jgi:hypothetical protein
MFCVFLYFTGLGSKSIKFQDYNEVGKLNFEFKEREVGKKSLILKIIQTEHVLVI